MHRLVKLAIQAVETYILRGETIGVTDYVDDEYKNNRAGVFVSLKIKGRLRGCIGTFMPVTDCIAEEVIRNAVAAATEDPRFQPVTAEELESLTFSVDILSPPQRVKDAGELDPRKYGIIVVKGLRKGLLLPDLDGIDTIDEQIRIAKMKAGIMDDEDVELFRFEVKRYR